MYFSCLMVPTVVSSYKMKSYVMKCLTRNVYHEKD